MIKFVFLSDIRNLSKKICNYKIDLLFIKKWLAFFMDRFLFRADSNFSLSPLLPESGEECFNMISYINKHRDFLRRTTEYISISQTVIVSF